MSRKQLCKGLLRPMLLCWRMLRGSSTCLCPGRLRCVYIYIYIYIYILSCICSYILSRGQGQPGEDLEGRRDGGGPRREAGAPRHGAAARGGISYHTVSYYIIHCHSILQLILYHICFIILYYRGAPGGAGRPGGRAEPLEERRRIV